MDELIVDKWTLDDLIVDDLTRGSPIPTSE